MNEIVITAKSDLGSGGFRRKVVTIELDIMRYSTEELHNVLLKVK